MTHPTIPELLPFREAPQLPTYGIHYPRTRDQIEWMYRRRAENGLAEAFTMVNGRRMFKPRRYLRLVGAKGARGRDAT